MAYRTPDGKRMDTFESYFKCFIEAAFTAPYWKSELTGWINEWIAGCNVVSREKFKEAALVTIALFAHRGHLSPKDRCDDDSPLAKALQAILDKLEIFDGDDESDDPRKSPLSK